MRPVLISYLVPQYKTIFLTSEQGDVKMKMSDWTDYFMDKRRQKTLNVISLEFSRTRYMAWETKQTNSCPYPNSRLQTTRLLKIFSLFVVYPNWFMDQKLFVKLTGWTASGQNMVPMTGMYTRKNLTSCSKSANKLSPSCVRTACPKLSTNFWTSR
jgi:hypothetical protein